MIGLDTNVLVRYFAQDDPVQAAQATRFIEDLTSQNPGFVTTVAMVELVWVMQRTLRYSPAEAARLIEHMLQSRGLLIEQADDVFTAMIAMKEDGADFADALIGALNARVGCSATMTFDKKAARLPGFALVK